MTMSPPHPQPTKSPLNTFPLDLDKVSLEQALRDFEIANARVLDLTQRLIASERRRAEVENELQQLRLSQRSSADESPQRTGIAAKLALKVVDLAQRIRR